MNEALPHDREEKPASKPNGGLGFYHYPRKMGKKRALERLKKAMIRVREKEIAKFKADIELIKGIK
jgi:hypothetical protein